MYRFLLFFLLAFLLFLKKLVICPKYFFTIWILLIIFFFFFFFPEMNLLFSLRRKKCLITYIHEVKHQHLREGPRLAQEALGSTCILVPSFVTWDEVLKAHSLASSCVRWKWHCLSQTHLKVMLWRKCKTQDWHWGKEDTTGIPRCGSD